MSTKKTQSKKEKKVILPEKEINKFERDGWTVTYDKKGRSITIIKPAPSAKYATS